MVELAELGITESEDLDGLLAKELFQRGAGITYADFTILNTRFSEITKEEVSLATDLGAGVKLQTPIIASPMDTVTNASLCIAIALEGGIGAIHYNHKNQDGSASIDAQVDEIRKVKRHLNGFIDNPIAVSPEMTIAEAIERGKKVKEDGIIEVFPVTDSGRSDGQLIGLLRKQDYFRKSRTETLVGNRMLRREKVATGEWPLTLGEARELLWEKRVPSLPIINKEGNLVYLVTRADMEKQEQFPLATKDGEDRLRVLFAVNTWAESYERLEAGFAAGADGVIVDTSQGYSKFALQMLQYIKKKYPDKLLIGGNISTKVAAQFLADEGIQAYRNGQGTGSICTTAGSIGISRAGAQGVYESARRVRNQGLSTIADGGLRQVGDLVKALTVGAHCTMLGNMLAGTEEGPGEERINPETGAREKGYRGMGSKEANAGGRRGYSRLPEGVAGWVPYRGSVHTWVPLIRDGLLHAMEVMNCRNLDELHDAMYTGEIQFERRTLGSMQEAGVHDLKR